MRRTVAVALTVLAAACGGPDAPEPAPPPRPPPAPEVSAAVDAPPGPPAPFAPESLAGDRAVLEASGEGFLATWAVLDGASWPAEAPPLRVARSVPFDLDGDAVTLGAQLVSRDRRRMHLLVGLRGEVQVFLDGAPVAAAASPDRYREDHALVRLTLSPGEHVLALTFRRPERGRFRVAIRVLDAEGAPGPGRVAMVVPAEERPVAESVAVTETHELVDGTPVLRLRVHRPGGGVRGDVEVRLGDRTGDLGDGAELIVPLAEGPPPVRVAGEDALPSDRHRASDRRVLEAAARFSERLAEAGEPSRAPLAWRRDEALRVVRERDLDPRWRRWLVRESRRRRDRFEAPRGYLRMAHFSRLDGTATPYELFAPPRARRRPTPVLVTLHGLTGNAGDYLRNTFGLPRDAENGEGLRDHGRHGAPPTSASMIVVAPEARGRSYYRHAGETAIFEVLEDVRRRLRVDDRRVYITGGSMGGTGAAYVPLRNPDVFAASAALAGYHDQRVRVDTDHAALSEVERFLEARRSDVDWAENALHLPMLLVRGTRDTPLAWTRNLAERLQGLRYRVEHREPELGHDVWTETYAEGAIFRWMARHRRPEMPPRVRLRTARERTLAAHWVRIEERLAMDRFAEVDVRYRDGAVQLAVAEGLRALTLSPGPPLHQDGAPLRVIVDGQTVEGPVPLTIERVDDGWHAAEPGTYPRAGVRQAGTAGPIRDVFHDPLLFVVGTQDPAQTLLNRLVAERWAHPSGWRVAYPVVDDDDVTPALAEGRHLVLVGPPASNSVHARLVDRLPIRVDASGTSIGERRHEGAGAVFVAPNPEQPDRSVLVIAGPDALLTWRSTALPDILPDYVIFDEGVEPARGRWACGGTGCAYREAGFLDVYGRAPPEVP
jgi:predicted esterase